MAQPLTMLRLVRGGYVFFVAHKEMNGVFHQVTREILARHAIEQVDQLMSVGRAACQMLYENLSREAVFESVVACR